MVQERKENTGKNLKSGRSGFVRARVDGEIRRLDEDIKLARYEKHTIELVVDRLKINAEEKADSLKAWKKHFNWVTVLLSCTTEKKSENDNEIHQDEDHLFSQLMACPSCQIALRKWNLVYFPLTRLKELAHLQWNWPD